MPGTRSRSSMGRSTTWSSAFPERKVRRASRSRAVPTPWCRLPTTRATSSSSRTYAAMCSSSSTATALRLPAWLSEGKSVYLHCVGGADRTGTLAFLIEALVGVSESDLSKDYELTSFDGSHTRRRSDPGQGNTEYILKYLINYLRQFEGSTINEKVVNWATTPYQGSSIPALTATEISQLQTLLVASQ